MKQPGFNEMSFTGFESWALLTWATHTHHGLVDLHKIFFAGPVINGEVNEALSTRIPFFNQLILNTPYGSK